MHYSPVRHSTVPASRDFAFDLHVLATPPAFVLSQDQTLHLIIVLSRSRRVGTGFGQWKVDTGRPGLLFEQPGPGPSRQSGRG